MMAGHQAGICDVHRQEPYIGYGGAITGGVRCGSSDGSIFLRGGKCLEYAIVYDERKRQESQVDQAFGTSKVSQDSRASIILFFSFGQLYLEVSIFYL